MNRRATPSIVANPVLVGAATVLVVIVGVFLAYNANNGLPFVPTYEVTAVVPDAAELVPGNDVRIGGKRVGVVDQIQARKAADGTVTAMLHMKLEKAVEPISTDTKVTIRPRSTLGLKYIELTPGTSGRKVPAGGTLPIAQSQPIVELDEALNTFDKQVRDATGQVVGTFADGLAGRGADLNEALEEINPLLTHLTPVMRALRSRSADLKGFIDGLKGAAVAIEPVRDQTNGLIDVLTTTFDAIDGAAPELQQVLDLTPATESIGTRALAVSRPVLDDAADIAVKLKPGADLLPRGTKALADIIATGTPVLKRGTTLGPDLESTLKAVGQLSRDPITTSSIVQLTALLGRLEPVLRQVNPFQTQCNYVGLFTRNAASTISDGDSTGNYFRFIQMVGTNQDLQSPKLAGNVHVTPYGVMTKDECETGNEPYRGTQVVGHPEGTQSNKTDTTGIPAGVSRTP